MKRYAGDLVLVHGDEDEVGGLRTEDFSHALLSNAHPDWKAYPGWKGHPFKDADGTPWHPMLAAMLSSIGIDPSVLQEATLEQIDTINLNFIVKRDSAGNPVESDDGLRLPEGHPALTGDNSPNIFDDPRTICAIMFWDVGQTNVIMLPPDGRTLFQFNDPNDEPPVTCILPRIPDARVTNMTSRIERGMEDAPLLRELVEFDNLDIGSVPIKAIRQSETSTVIEME